MTTTMSAIEENPKKPLARPLPVLVPLIKEQLELGDAAAEQAGLPYYREAGKMLREAKPQVEKGTWGNWLEANFKRSQRTAAVYMDLAHHYEVKEAFQFEEDTNSQPASNRKDREFKTLSEFAQPGRESHQPAWHNPVQEALKQANLDRLHRERMAKEQELRIVHQLAGQIIDIGYKVLAAKLHPDKGGSEEAMQRLNRAKNLLKKSI